MDIKPTWFNLNQPSRMYIPSIRVIHEKKVTTEPHGFVQKDCLTARLARRAGDEGEGGECFVGVCLFLVVMLDFERGLQSCQTEK